MTQNAAILAHLQAGRCLDPMTALRRFGCFRLAARVLELRAQGYRIECKLFTSRAGKRFGVYRLIA